jgi:hypothetical protein
MSGSGGMGLVGGRSGAVRGPTGRRDGSDGAGTVALAGDDGASGLLLSGKSAASTLIPVSATAPHIAVPGSTSTPGSALAGAPSVNAGELPSGAGGVCHDDDEEASAAWARGSCARMLLCTNVSWCMPPSCSLPDGVPIGCFLPDAAPWTYACFVLIPCVLLHLTARRMMAPHRPLGPPRAQQRAAARRQPAVAAPAPAPAAKLKRIAASGSGLGANGPLKFATQLWGHDGAGTTARPQLELAAPARAHTTTTSRTSMHH